MADFDPIPFRIRIGVTGHRTLHDAAAIQALVARVLHTEVEKLFPEQSREIIERVRNAGTTAVSYRILSPLAEGADRLVARTVLAEPNARLQAVLPMTVEDYLEDFQTEASVAEFQELLTHSRKPVCLRTRRIRDDRHDPGDQAALRRDSYAQVGQYIVDHCDVLIAIWDGLPSRGRGGTAEIVQYAEEQNRPIIRIWEGAIELVNPGRNNGLDATALDAIDRFNQQRITPARRTAYAASLNHDHFVKPKTAGDIPAATRDFVNKFLFPYYAQASIVAKASRDRFHRAGKAIYLFSAAAVGCAAIGVLFPKLATPAFAVELAFLVIMTLMLWQARRQRSHQNWIEYRFLDERLRCGIFMAICGVEPKPIEVLPYMGHSQTLNDWTVRVFDEIWDRLPPLAGCTEGECLILNP